MTAQPNPNRYDSRIPYSIRTADAEDLGAINDVIMRSVATWSATSRLIDRMAPLFFVDETDLDHMDIRVAEVIGIVGVCSVVPMDPAESWNARQMAQIHGVFVDPLYVGGGLGAALVADAEARSRGRVDALFCKAQKDARGFFTQVGYTSSMRSNYPHSFVKALTPPDGSDLANPDQARV